MEKDSYGGVRKNHRDFSTTPIIIDYPCKSREDWEALKPRLEPSDFRMNWVSDLKDSQRKRRRG